MELDFWWAAPGACLCRCHIVHAAAESGWQRHPALPQHGLPACLRSGQPLVCNAKPRCLLRGAACVLAAVQAVPLCVAGVSALCAAKAGTYPSTRPHARLLCGRFHPPDNLKKGPAAAMEQPYT